MIIKDQRYSTNLLHDHTIRLKYPSVGDFSFYVPRDVMISQRRKQYLPTRFYCFQIVLKNKNLLTGQLQSQDKEVKLIHSPISVACSHYSRKFLKAMLGLHMEVAVLEGRIPICLAITIHSSYTNPKRNQHRWSFLFVLFTHTSQELSYGHGNLYIVSDHGQQTNCFNILHIFFFYCYCYCYIKSVQRRKRC